ncbi:unnamed protein product [Owenia fusiformis]|uniref:DNA polymerase epsilon subunit 3 n=1 Tax=Owenia fusiformis TaxID=6347 RepID=A0A8J1XVK6_OWEFU|nr:unnamed protein product [Owenia fusiformis]
MAERPEDLNLPNAIIARIVKESLPDGVAVSKDAKLAISKAASVFVLYATSCANNYAMKAKRKTLNAQDVISAMDDMEFSRLIQPMEECLQAYRKEQKGKKEAAESRKKAREAEGGEDNDDGEDEKEEEVNGEEDTANKDGSGD